MIVDSYILDKIERFAYWTEDLFGITALHWERVFLAAQVASLLYEEFTQPRIFVSNLYLILLGAAAFIASFLIPPPTGNFSNSMKITNVYARCLFLLLTIIDLFWIKVGMFRSPWIEFATIAMYFAACDRRPPQESRLSQWLASLSEMRLKPMVSS